MKMSISIALSIFYMAFTTGLGINVHYCGDRVASVEFAFMDADCCCGPEEADDDGCCSNETVVFQTEADQQASGTLQLKEMAAVETGWTCLQDEEIFDADIERRFEEVPPDIPNPPLFLKYSRLILYG